LFDVAGEVTRAGSKALAEEAKPAAVDAPVVHRLRAAGAIIVAKTNMTEFAYSGIGANPHYGTPGNPADRKRVPGGSSAGAAVAAADGMCEIAIGTDTGGSCRIPGALCGIVGYKPSRQRIPTEGAFPLSYSIDSIGPLARAVEACAKADAVMAGERFVPSDPASLAGLRIGLPQGFPLENLDETVAKRFSQALDMLKRAGARLTDETLSQFDGMAQVNSKGGVQPAEAFAVHRDLLSRRADAIDPNVRVRLERARNASAADYIDMVRDRARLIRSMDARLADLDVLASPTTPTSHQPWRRLRRLMSLPARTRCCCATRLSRIFSTFAPSHSRFHAKALCRPVLCLSRETAMIIGFSVLPRRLSGYLLHRSRQLWLVDRKENPASSR
jgi:aspartyl-tRNA(Asn)/glutamyl-tRNA(Gln) amidotransferase subunit A